jgi:hypothetical protein
MFSFFYSKGVSVNMKKPIFMLMLNGNANSGGFKMNFWPTAVMWKFPVHLDIQMLLKHAHVIETCSCY